MSNSRKELTSAIQRIQAYWDQQAQTAGDDCQRVEFSRRAQRMRFEAFVVDHDLHGKSILDVGCGVGSLSAHLRERGIACDYVGLDLSPEMIRRCRERFPEAVFERADILRWDPGRQFDYVVAFGIHNKPRLDNGAEVLAAVTQRQFDLCRLSAHVSLLTDRYPAGFGLHLQAWRAEEVLTVALAITPHVVLRHDYLPNDFSVTLYREPLIDTRRDLLLDYRQEDPEPTSLPSTDIVTQL